MKEFQATGAPPDVGWEMRLLVVYAPAGAERGLRDTPDCQRMSFIRVLPPGEVP